MRTQLEFYCIKVYHTSPIHGAKQVRYGRAVPLFSVLYLLFRSTLFSTKPSRSKNVIWLSPFLRCLADQSNQSNDLHHFDICLSTFCLYQKECDNTLIQRRQPVGQIMPLSRLKSYLTAGRAGEFDTTTENNTMLIQIQTWYLYKYFITGRAGEFETANETHDQTNVTFYMTQCIVHFNSTQYLNQGWC